MLDVHPPHGSMHGVRDFLLPLVTIRVGLLIALGLEGCVERQHHRHLVHEAEAGMRREIAENAQGIPSLRKQLADQQRQLDGDIDVLKRVKVHPGGPHEEVGFTFAMRSFDDLTWKTAQTTGALALMPYGDATRYAEIYNQQDELYREQREIVVDAMRAASIIVTQAKAEQPTPTQVDTTLERIGLVKLRLLLLNSYIDNLDGAYQRFLKEHPAE